MNILNNKTPLNGAWKTRFQDVSELNKFAKSNPVDISDSVIENKNIDGAKIHAGKIKNTDWKNVKARNAHFSNITFHEGTIEDVDFSHSILTNVVFENMRLVEARFFHATLKNVRFLHCTFNGSNIDQTVESNIEVIDSNVINTSLSEGQLVAIFQNSQLYKGTSLTDLEPPSSLSFKNCELDKVEISRSVLDKLILNTVKSYKSGFNTGSIRKIDITGGDISFGLSETKIDVLKVHDVNNVGLAIPLSNIENVEIENCKKIEDLNLYQSSINKINIKNCDITNFLPTLANISEMYLNHCTITGGDFEEMKVKSFYLQNVNLGGKLDFTNAKVGSLYIDNITKQPGLKLITDGSNVQL